MGKFNHSHLAISFFQVIGAITCLQLEGRPALAVTQHLLKVLPHYTSFHSQKNSKQPSFQAVDNISYLKKQSLHPL